ncbi:hypothetical protein [Tenacibaculum aiptasiae]|uniref:hypothetical protein n=1 Tax=Tenacibaculum aiptasiae TaxID=426481 RepID=UPI00232E3B4C|nr:hypothetical protein [Tenacibaculum aiptasiae]
MYTKIDEELRQYKLFKIQETESKLRRFKKVYLEIKEHLLIKLTKNASSNLIGYAVYIISFLLLIVGIIFFFPNDVLNFLESTGEPLSSIEKKEFTEFFNFLKYFFITASLLFGFISYLLKLNNEKRSNIYNLYKLLEEVMDYMENSAKEDKKKYEYFVDSIAEKEAATSII